MIGEGRMANLDDETITEYTGEGLVTGRMWRKRKSRQRIWRNDRLHFECAACTRVLPSAEFYWHKDQRRHSSRCKECR